MRRPLRSALAPAAVALTLAACGPEEDDLPPTGGPPPAGFATEMLDAHNAVRAAATPIPEPPLPPLSWSADVAATAQAWADRCSWGHNPGRGDLGENLAANAPPGRTAAQIVGTATGTTGWAREAAYYDRASNTCTTANPPNQDETCGHYTQLVWRSTTVVGCGVRTCTTGSPFAGFTEWELWVCDYAPPGNWVGQRPY